MGGGRSWCFGPVSPFSAVPAPITPPDAYRSFPALLLASFLRSLLYTILSHYSQGQEKEEGQRENQNKGRRQSKTRAADEVKMSSLEVFLVSEFDLFALVEVQSLGPNSAREMLICFPHCRQFLADQTVCFCIDGVQVCQQMVVADRLELPLLS